MKIRYLAIGTIVGALMTAGVAFGIDAAATAPGTTFYACLAGGKLTLVGTSTPTCKAKGASLISWDSAGPAGNPGTNGTDGAPGTNGISFQSSPAAPTAACNPGDSDLDQATGEVFTCDTTGTWQDALANLTGPAGTPGADGAPGAPGAPGPSHTYSAVGTTTITDPGPTFGAAVVTLAVPAGSYTVTGNASFTSVGGGSMLCYLESGTLTNQPYGESSGPTYVSMSTSNTFTFASPSTITLWCMNTAGTYSPYGRSITATAVGGIN